MADNYFYTVDNKLLIKAEDNTIVTEHNLIQNNLVSKYINTSVVSIEANSEVDIPLIGIESVQAILISSNSNTFDVSLRNDPGTGLPSYGGIYGRGFYRVFDNNTGAMVDHVKVKAFNQNVSAKVTVVGIES